MSEKLSPMIKGLAPGLTELGKIKIGMKGHMMKSRQGNEFQPPQKLDHFRITTLERDDTGNYIVDQAIHDMIAEETGQAADHITRIPIMFLFDDINLNFQSRYVCFKGRTQFCTGDGEKANRTDVKEAVTCPCERSAFDYVGTEKCKMNGVLSCIIRGANSIGGAWKFRTTSVNSIQGVYSSLVLLSKTTGGMLAGIELDLVLVPKAATSPDGKAQTIYVVGVAFTGGSMRELRDASLKLIESDAHYRDQMRLLESNVKDVLTADIEEGEEDAYIEEFVPENVEGYVAPETKSPPKLDLNAAVEIAAGESADESADEGTTGVADEPETEEATQQTPAENTPSGPVEDAEFEDIF